MPRSLLSRVAQTLIQIAVAIPVLLSAQAQAQSIVGTWENPEENYTFQANGRWISAFVSPICSVTETAGGTYAASGGSISMTQDSSFCSGSTLNILRTPRSLGSGTYTVSGNGLVIHLTGGFVSPIDFILTARASTIITATTPLPPPPAVQIVYTAPSGQMPAAAVEVAATGTFGNASLSVTLDIVQALQTTAATGFAASAYNVYVIALVPGAVVGSASPLIFIKAQAGWGALRFPLAPYLENVGQGTANNRVLIEILTNNDITFLVGTEIYIGYGESDLEMLTSGRYRGVYRVQ